MEKKNTNLGSEWAVPLDQLKVMKAYPGLVYIEGGIAKVGVIEDNMTMYGLDQVGFKTPFDSLDPQLRWMHGTNDMEGRFRLVACKSFYMDEAEVANIHYLEYLYDVKKQRSIEEYELALPDTTVWSDRYSFNDPMVQYYLRHPGFRFYPVVGVSWQQALNYAKWRTEMVSKILPPDSGKEAGELVLEGVTTDEDGKLKDISKLKFSRRSSVSIPEYRLPTESEWEYAAVGRTGAIYSQIKRAREYPWDGQQLRNPYGGKKKAGLFFANYKRGKGDYAGVYSGRWNDVHTSNVYDYPPNDFGLYNMAGNVNEWVQDFYREGEFDEYVKPDVQKELGVKEGDEVAEDSVSSNLDLDEPEVFDPYSYDYGNTIDLRIYKGGSWSDGPMWLSPGARRWWPADSSTATIGFRCAMTIEVKEKEEEKEEEVFEDPENPIPGQNADKVKEEEEDVPDLDKSSTPLKEDEKLDDRGF